MTLHVSVFWTFKVTLWSQVQAVGRTKSFRLTLLQGTSDAVLEEKCGWPDGASVSGLIHRFLESRIKNFELSAGAASLAFATER